MRSLLIAVVNSISFTSISFACVEVSEPSPLFFHIIGITCECVPLTVTTCLHDTFVCLILQYLIMKDIIEYFSMCFGFFNINRAELWLVSDGISDQEAQQMRVRRFSDLQEAVDQALTRTSPSPEVLLVHDATEIFLSLDAKEI